ncbi:receptor-like protein kinase [Seminavis robusta]|uniref:Receptor-like protein kinase n=1 Tax=Seminavis robusta TaxID=568900 RepID=A0A9N8HGI5_9STRA|nr:receptor-like protein kinase [Seminavis robusta]|eukprot:Sro486_g152640.1 receptor-like protein kinase (770) ;mRNA; f:33566-35952
MTISSLLSFTLILLLVSVAAAYPLRPIGQTLVGRLPHDGRDRATSSLRFSHSIKMSDDGRRLLVGAPSKEGGSVFLYELGEETMYNFGNSRSHTSGEKSYRWKLLQQLQGEVDEPIGDSIALSHDGQTLAVVRYDSRHSDVEVYRYKDETKQTIMMGSPVNTCNGDRLLTHKAVHLGYTDLNSQSFPDTTWLVVSCEHEAGRVDVFRYDESAQDWQLFVVIHGDDGFRGTRFGWALEFVPAETLPFDPRDEPLFLLGVASPFYSNSTGLVQLFSVDLFGEWSEHSRFEGLADGDLHGYSFAMSSNNDPTVAIGAPGANRSKGRVEVKRWMRGGFHLPRDWHLLDEVMLGSAEGESFGRAVAIANDGSRVAAASIHNSGYFRVYDLAGGELSMVGQVSGGHAEASFGFDIAMNGRGSLVASGDVEHRDAEGNSVGRVRVFLDQTPYCGVPAEQPFLARQRCQEQIHVPNRAECNRLFSYELQAGCVWIGQDDGLPFFEEPLQIGLESSNPSGVPSAIPSEVPSSNSPSHVPSSSPSVLPSEVPSFAPSVDPTEGPSLAPSNPTIANGPVPSPHATHEPTNLYPLASATSEPSNWMPSLAPTAKSSWIQSHVPSHSPYDQPRDEPNHAPSSGTSGGVKVHACFCDEDGFCIEKSFSATSSLDETDFCIFVDGGGVFRDLDMLSLKLEYATAENGTAIEALSFSEDSSKACSETTCALRSRLEYAFNDSNDVPASLALSMAMKVTPKGAGHRNLRASASVEYEETFLVTVDV